MSTRVAQRMTKTGRRLTRYFGSSGVLSQLPGSEQYDVATGKRSSTDPAINTPCTVRIISDNTNDPNKENATKTTIVAKLVDLPDGIVPKEGDVLYDGFDISTALAYKVTDSGPRRIGDKIVSWVVTVEL